MKTQFSLCKNQLLPLVAAFAALAIPSLTAAPITVTNANFEDTFAPDNGWSSSATGWTINVGPDYDGGTLNQTSGTPFSDSLAPHSGVGETKFVYAYSANPPNNGVFSQILSVDLAADTTYTLTADVGARNGGVAFNGYKLQLFAGATLLNEIVGNSSSIGAGLWITPVVTYTSGNSVTSGQALSIQLVGIGGTGGGNQALFDNVSLDATAVPEPSTVGLLVVSLGVGLGMLRRRA